MKDLSLRNRFWVWLLRFAYRRIKPILDRVPNGVPCIRDIDNPCEGYSPTKAMKEGANWHRCQGDGHYLCKECVFWTGEKESDW